MLKLPCSQYENSTNNHLSSAFGVVESRMISPAELRESGLHPVDGPVDRDAIMSARARDLALQDYQLYGRRHFAYAHMCLFVNV
jgi:hypothetical protein